MAEETKEKILETEAVRDRIEALKKSVAEMAEYSYYYNVFILCFIIASDFIHQTSAFFI